MKITSLRIIVVVGALGAILGLKDAYPGETTFMNLRDIAQKGGGGVGIAFPDVCKTPSPGGPVPVPCPNIIRAADSDFGAGTKTTKDGKKIYIKPTKIKTSKGDEPGYEVSVFDKTGRKILLDEPRLFQLTDRTFCAVCVENGLLTNIFELWLVTEKE